MKQEDGSLKLPALCAKCGKEQPNVMWMIKGTEISFNSLSVFTAIGGRLLMDTHSYRLPVPVHNKCFSQLRRINWILNILLTLSIVFSCFGFIFVITNFNDAPLIAFVGIVATVIIYTVKTFVAPIGFYDGTFFSFKNKKFHHEFTKLNPGLGRPRNMSDTLNIQG